MAFVQGKTNATGGTGTALITFDSNLTAGNLVWCGIRHNSSATPTVVDTQLNAYSQAGTTQAAPAATRYGSVFIAPNVAGGACTLTVTDLGVFAQMQVGEYSGLALASVLDQVAQANGTGTAINAGTLATLFASETIITFVWSEGAATWTHGTNYTLRESNVAPLMQFEDRAAATTGSYTGDMIASPSVAWGAIAISLKPPAAASTGVIQLTTLQNTTYRAGP